DYPEFTGTTTVISRTSWSKGTNPDYQRDYMEWYFHDLPRGAGVTADGKQNNWYKYIYDYVNYSTNGAPLPFRASAEFTDLVNLVGCTYEFRVLYASPKFVTLGSIGTGDVVLTGPGGFNQTA